MTSIAEETGTAKATAEPKATRKARVAPRRVEEGQPADLL